MAHAHLHVVTAAVVQVVSRWATARAHWAAGQLDAGRGAVAFTLHLWLALGKAGTAWPPHMPTLLFDKEGMYHFSGQP